MATFQELQARITDTKYRRTVIQHLIEYIDTNFRPIAGGDAKNKLLTEDKIPVPASVFESIVSEVLVRVDGDLEARVLEILGSNIQEVPAAPPPVVEEKKTKKSTPKDEAKS